MDVTGVMSPATEAVDADGPAPKPFAALAGALWQGLTYAARTVGVPAGVRGLAVEVAYTAVHVSLYPWGLVDEVLRPAGTFAHHRTEDLSPSQRSLVVSDMDASTTPVLLVHGIVDNRSIFAVLSRALRRRGFGVVHAVNFSVLTAFTGVDTLVTLGTPHRGSLVAHFLPPTRVPQQLQPGSDLLRELEGPAPGCRTRFLAVWSRQDQLVIPQSAARLDHPDLQVSEVELEHVGHLSMTIDPEVVHVVSRLLARCPVRGSERNRALAG
jgi:triacylglycerol lipase